MNESVKKTQRKLKPEIKRNIISDNILMANIMKYFNYNNVRIVRALKKESNFCVNYNLLTLLVDYYKDSELGINSIDDLLE